MISLENIHLQINNQILLENEKIDIYEGYIHVIMGESGCGKTTLLHEISLLSHLSNAVYKWNERRIDELNDVEKTEIRREHIGYILQDLELISEDLSLYDNLDCMFALSGKSYNQDLVQQYMKELNLNCSLNQTVESMSRGERQRFALLLALIKDVELFICDEPTSALDVENANELMKYLKIIARKHHKMVLIASHDYLVSEQADVLYHIENKHIIIKRNNQQKQYEHEVHEKKRISNRFYKIYNKTHKKITKYLIKLIYVIMMMVLTIVPLIISSLLAKQQELYSMYASNEIVVVNTKTPIPSCTFNNASEIFNEDQSNLLSEIEHVEEIEYYWEMEGQIVTNEDSIDVLVVPKKDIDTIIVPTSITENINNASLDLSLCLENNEYEFETSIQQYTIKDYPIRRNTELQIIYMPYSMMKDILSEQNIKESSSICVYVDDIDKVEETAKVIQRWFNNATVTSSGSEYMDQIELLETIQQYMVILRIVLIVGIIAVVYTIQTMENKSREKEISHLRINGLGKEVFYRLYYYENRMLVLITILSCILGYILSSLIYELSYSALNILMILAQLVVYIILTRVLPIYVTLKQIFRKDISAILRDY